MPASSDEAADRGGRATGDGAAGDAVFAADEATEAVGGAAEVGRENVAVGVPAAGGGAVGLGAEAVARKAGVTTKEGSTGEVGRIAAGAGAKVVGEGAGSLIGRTTAGDGVPRAAGFVAAGAGVAVDDEGAGAVDPDAARGAETPRKRGGPAFDVHPHGVGVGRGAKAAAGHHAGAAKDGGQAPEAAHAHPGAVEPSRLKVAISVAAGTAGAGGQDAGGRVARKAAVTGVRADLPGRAVPAAEVEAPAPDRGDGVARRGPVRSASARDGP